MSGQVPICRTRTSSPIKIHICYFRLAAVGISGAEVYHVRKSKLTKSLPSRADRTIGEEKISSELLKFLSDYESTTKCSHLNMSINPARAKSPSLTRLFSESTSNLED